MRNEGTRILVNREDPQFGLAKQLANGSLHRLPIPFNTEGVRSVELKLEELLGRTGPRLKYS